MKIVLIFLIIIWVMLALYSLFRPSKLGIKNRIKKVFEYLIASLISAVILIVFFPEENESIDNSESASQKTQINETEQSYFVNIEKANVRLEPNKKGKITNSLYKGQKLKIYETKNGWARISKYYDGKKEGIAGNIARWIYAKNITQSNPNKITKENSRIKNALKNSDDYEKYKKEFVFASEKLINNKKCTIKDFKEMGGWLRSTNVEAGNTYFTYCGKMRKENRIYLNVLTGDIFK